MLKYKGPEGIVGLTEAEACAGSAVGHSLQAHSAVKKSGLHRTQNLFSSWLFILEKTGSVNLSPNGGCVPLSLHGLLRLYCSSHPFQRLLNSPKHSLCPEG